MGKYKHFYSTKTKIPNGAISLSQIQQKILRKIEEKPCISPNELASSCGISKQLVSYHIRVLSSSQPPYIKLEKNGRKVKCYIYLENDEEIESEDEDFVYKDFFEEKN